MTDHQTSTNGAKTTVQDIRHTSRVIERLAHHCMSSDMSDVTFIVEDEKLPAHRVILAIQSEYFRALLCGKLAEATQDEILLKEVPLKAFKLLLTYIYTGNMLLAEVEEADLLDTLKLGHMYGFTDLVNSISNHLIQVLTLDNVLAVLEAAAWDMKTLSNACYEYFDENAETILQHETFRNLSPDTICSLLSRDTFYVPEVQVFRAVDHWRRHNLNCEKVDVVMSKVRFSLMTTEQLLLEVRSSEILSKDDLLDAMTEQFTSTQLPYRAMTLPEQNVACKKFNCQIIQGKNPSALLNGNQTEDGCLSHDLDDPQGIVLELDKLYIINHIKMRLWDEGSRIYSYYVEVSTNQKDWNRVVDHRDYCCRSWQFLHFQKQAVRYIRLLGTNNNENRLFHVIQLEAMFSKQNRECQIVNGIQAPTHNVTTQKNSATVIEGRVNGDSLQILLDGDVDNYNGTYGYVYHTINYDKIEIQLGQPYWIGSVRLLLWDGDDRSYSFYIETSTDLEQWHMIVDKRHDLLQSWQQFTFEPRIVVFIRIVGTHNTENRDFHCVHFECPSQ